MIFIQLLPLLIPLVLLFITYISGRWIEKNHYKQIREREQALVTLPALNFYKTLPPEWKTGEVTLVTGSVVISLDYFKRFLAGLRSIVGGRVTAYESLLDRARREAILRMKEDAKAHGFDAVVNMRLETSRIASAAGDGEGTAAIEILAYGTGIRRAPSAR